MAYFPNGTAGLSFEEFYCQHCLNKPVREDDDCPIWSAHLLYSYELCNEKEHPGKVILDMLIEPEGPTCKMFIDKRKLPMMTTTDRELQEQRDRERPKLIEWPPKEKA